MAAVDSSRATEESPPRVDETRSTSPVVVPMSQSPSSTRSDDGARGISDERDQLEAIGVRVRTRDSMAERPTDDEPHRVVEAALGGAADVVNRNDPGVI